MADQTKKFKILFADANNSVLTVFKIFESDISELEPNTYDFVYVNTGREVLDVLMNEKIDLAVIDYYLPEINGLEILEHLALKGIKVPVIFQTQRGNEKIAINAFKLGLKDYFIKSNLSFEELYSSILNIIRNDNELPGMLASPEVPSLNFLSHHLESVLKGYQQEIHEEDLVPGQDYIFAFMSTKVFHDYNMESYFSYDEIKALLKNIKSFISKNAKESYAMKWIDKEDFMLHTFVGKNLVTNCLTCALNCFNGLYTYNLAHTDIPDNIYLTITLNYGEAKYEPNKEVLVSSALNYNVHSIQFVEDPGIYASEFFHANMNDKAKIFFKPSFVLEEIQNFKYSI